MLVSVATIAPQSAHAAAQFTGDSAITSDSGNAQISWEADGPVRLVLSEPGGHDRLLYEGEAASYFLTGLNDGEYELTLHGTGIEVSAPLELTVTHQSLSRALWLAGLGALVFLATLAVIVRGARS